MAGTPHAAPDGKPPTGSDSGVGGSWRFAWATQVGSMHVARDEVREDAVGIHVHADGIVAAVADGHGTKRAFRAHIGSELAVRAAIDAALRGRLRWAGADAATWLAGEFTRDVVARWRTLVARHVAEHPLPVPEPDDGIPKELLDPGDAWLAYGTTALVAITITGRLLLWQLGDGDIVVESADGAGKNPLPPDPVNVGNRTSSLCFPDAEKHARSTVWDLGRKGVVAVLATDGFGNAMAATDWRARLTADLRSQLAERGFDDVAASLPAWCATCADASGDDVSVVVLEGEPSEVPTVLLGASRTSLGDRDSDTVPARRRARSWRPSGLRGFRRR